MGTCPRRQGHAGGRARLAARRSIGVYVRLILTRHGQTPSNVAGLLDTTVPGAQLTEFGERQAEALVTLLEGERVDAVFASSQVRAQQTAAPLAVARGLEVVVRPGLREIGAGTLEMRSDGDAVGAYAAMIASVAAGRLDAANPEAESGHDLIGRFDGVVEEIAGLGHESVVVVSHGAMLRTWTGLRAQNLDAAFVAANPLPNTAIVTLDGDPGAGWRAHAWDGARIGAHGAPAGVPRVRGERGF